MVAFLFVGHRREPLTVRLGRKTAIFGSPFLFVHTDGAPAPIKLAGPVQRLGVEARRHADQSVQKVFRLGGERV
jgi:hypothetical protein